MTELTTTQSVKQSMRSLSLGLGERFRVVSAKTSRAYTKVLYRYFRLLNCFERM